MSGASKNEESPAQSAGIDFDHGNGQESGENTVLEHVLESRHTSRTLTPQTRSKREQSSDTHEGSDDVGPGTSLSAVSTGVQRIFQKESDSLIDDYASLSLSIRDTQESILQRSSSRGRRVENASVCPAIGCLPVGNPRSMNSSENGQQREIGLTHRSKFCEIVPSEQSKGEAEQFLNAVGFPQYVKLFEDNHVSGELLPSLENVALREELGIEKLRHRREILKGVRALREDGDSREGRYVPEFGRILIHLSNMRTLHSWVRVGFQHFLFAIALTRTAPSFRGREEVILASIYMWSMGLVVHMYGMRRYWCVAHVVDTQPDGEIFVADKTGTLLLALATTGTAALILHFVLMDGFRNS